MRKIVFGDNLEILPNLENGSVNLIYVDPPFNTGKEQKHTQIRTTQVEGDEVGDRQGFQGKRYSSEIVGSKAFADEFADYLGFLAPRLEQAHRVLKADGSIFLHLDYREIHYAKIVMDEIFGRDSFMNEIIWAYDFGGRPKSRWPAKHDNILWYAKNPDEYTFNFDEMDRIPYMAPGLVGEEKAKRGKTPTDVWWHTIVPTNSKERTGYPTQKPLGVLDRIIKIHSNRGELVLDFFAGSGTTGKSAAMHGRDFLLIDNNREAIEVMAERLADWQPEIEGCDVQLPQRNQQQLL